MGFFLQLRILLWKNLTLKKRSPFVLAFELFIPLVLFVILLLIRQKQPPHAIPSKEYNAQPLPSAGVVSIMQAFCSDGQRDDTGFINYPQNKVQSFLQQFKEVAENNNFFEPDFSPGDMDQLPELYRSIIEDPVAFHNQINRAKNFHFNDILANLTRIDEFMVKNLSIPQPEINVLVHSTVNITKLYYVIFGSYPSIPVKARQKRAIDTSMFSGLKDLSGLAGLLPDELGPQSLQGLSHGILWKIIKNDPRLMTDPKVLKVAAVMLGLAGDQTVTPLEVIQVLKLVLLSGAGLKTLTCDSKVLTTVLIPPTSQDYDTLYRMCNMSDAQWDELSQVLNRDIDSNKIIQQLNLQDFDVVNTGKRVKAFIQNLQEFIMFEKNLMELSKFASNLPKDACETSEVDIQNGTDATPLLNMTGSPQDGVEESSGGPTHKKQQNKYGGLLKIWIAMQSTICGRPDISKQTLKEFSETNDLSLLGLTSKQKYDLGILVHVLYSNPKVLYAPNGTNADLVVQRANETFVLIDRISEYARKWLNVSQEIRDYLLKNTTEANLNDMREMREELKQFDGTAVLVQNSPVIRQFLQNGSVPNVDFFLKQLDIIDNAACSWLHLIDGISLNVYRGFRTEEELVDYVLNEAYADNVTILASVIFTNMNPDGTLPPHIIYKIRQNATFIMNTKKVRPAYWFPGPMDWNFNYYQFGFVWIQDIFERAMIDTYAGRSVVEPGAYIEEFPYPCYMKDQFLFMIEHVMPLCLTISWVYTVAMLVQSIVYEKELRLKEVMKMMGMSNAVHWLAWFLTTFTQMSISMGILTCMLKYGHVLEHSNSILIFLVLQVFAIATIAFSFLMSVLYSKARLAAACAGIVYFMSYVPYMYVAIREDAAGDKIPAWAKSITSLFSTTAFGLGAKYFAFYEIEGVGVQWDNIYISPVEGDQFNLFLVVLMMVLDAMFYGLLTWYIENVHPGSYGLPKPWYFPFTRSYWCGHIRTEQQCSWRQCFGRDHIDLSIMEEDQACALADTPDASHFEQDPSHIPLGVTIDGLSKVYKTGKLALNKLTLNLYQDQITSFLGHNGAGKTTTMSILTGLFPPSSGYAKIYGLDIRSDMEEIRKTLGMCPQHNVLFDKLTVEEHLWFYAKLKGMSSRDIKDETESMIRDIELPHKRHNTVDCLSGGMKRKLSVAIAFVAGSRTVILDEPTAGVDPYARRAIWDLLVKYKTGRTILLSTHHMDEADLLGDRIAIISNGQLKCCGSSLFLKSTFGEGYHLKLVKKPSELDTQSVATDTLSAEGLAAFHSNCSETVVSEFLQSHVVTAYLKSQTNQELHYILPFEEAKKGNFEKLFKELDKQLAKLEVSSYGVMDTSLEEVFLAVTEQAQQALLAEEEVDTSDKKDVKLLDSIAEVSLADVNIAEVKTQALDVGSDCSLLLDLPSQVELGDIPRGPTPVLPSSRETRNVIRHRRSVSDVSLLDVSEPSADNMLNQAKLSPKKEKLQFKEGLELEGRGTYRVQGHWLLLQQFFAIIVKRYVYVRRNWKGLFSQILLPAMFVCVAMTVALTAPQVQDMPPLVLSPAMYYNYTQPRGNFIPYLNVAPQEKQPDWVMDASPEGLINTFHLPSGIAATCVLKSPFNSSFDAAKLHQINSTYRNFALLEKYFEPECQSVFRHGIPLGNFVPDAPTASDTVTAANISGPVLPAPTEEPSQHRYYPKCHCSADKTTFICDKSGFETPPSFQVVTSDILQDITGVPEIPFYLHTTDIYRLHRYGAFAFGNIRHYVPEEFGRHAPTVFRKLAVRRVAKVWYNHKGYHSMPVYVNALNNAILRANLPKSMGNPAAYGITLINHPMNNTDHMKTVDYIEQGSDVLIAIFIIVAMSFVPASFVLFLVYERSIKAKHLQFVSGISRIIYWLANYVWDMCNYLIPAGACIIILRVFDIPSYTSATNFPAVVALFLMYGWSITPMMYPASFVFKEPSTAYIFLIVINLFVGITCIITSFLLEMFGLKDHDLAHIHEILKNVFLIFPNYCLGRGLMDIAFNEYQNEYLFKTGQYSKMKSPFEWNIMSRNLVAMAIMGFSFFLITLLCEFNFFMKPRRLNLHPMAAPLNEDNDVAMERRRVMRGTGKRDLIRLQNLTKIYKTRKLGRHLAVDRVCLGVPQGECFGLLGVNGAGKTTTFKMLTGDLPPTAGNAFLNGNSILSDIGKVQANMGYCPQFDALYDELTAREHLMLYARLRGVPCNQQKQVVDWALGKLCLEQYADKVSGTYSGGNKRKLSTAIALIGQAPVIFLDEPTTGMDPHSRRFLWDLILDLIKSGRSVILTSHSMEECEALCTRLAIMVNGSFKCLGSTQHLKTRFGDGYTASIRVKGPNYEREMNSIMRFMQRNFPSAVLKDQHHNQVQYQIHSCDLSLGHLFAKMEEAQRDLRVEDYSISQNTLDNVFINFVKQQVEILHAPDDHSLVSEPVTATPEQTYASNSPPTELQTWASSSEETIPNLSDGEDDPLLDSNSSSQRRLSFSGVDLIAC